MLDRLERRDFVRRIPDPVDRRKVLVEMTEQGLGAVGQFYGPIARDGARQLEELTPGELEAIKTYLIRSRRLIEDHRQRLVSAVVDAKGPAG
jgi:DNA-binding MarR family transcriptional regulator